MKLLNIVELLGAMAFAFSGALSAMQKKLDVFGILVITFVTAVGGGTLRDMLIGSLPVAWILNIQLIAVIFTAYLIALFFQKYLRLLGYLIFWLDTIGLTLFCLVAINIGIEFHLHPVICIALGTITGTFGGVTRDVLLNEIPYVFRKDIYASACIAGGIVYFLLMQFNFANSLSGIIAGITIICIRVGAKHFNWRMPDIYKEKS